MAYRLYQGTVGKDGDYCDNPACNKRILGQERVVIRNDGALFCDAACAEACGEEPITDKHAARIAL